MAEMDPVIVQLDQAIFLLEDQLVQVREARRLRLEYLEQDRLQRLAEELFPPSMPESLRSRIALANRSVSPVELSGLPPAVYNSLLAHNFVLVEQFLLCEAEDVASTRHIGPKAMEKIRRLMEQKHFTFASPEEGQWLDEEFKRMERELVALVLMCGIQSYGQLRRLTEQQLTTLLVSVQKGRMQNRWYLDDVVGQIRRYIQQH